MFFLFIFVCCIFFLSCVSFSECLVDLPSRNRWYPVHFLRGSALAQRLLRLLQLQDVPRGQGLHHGRAGHHLSRVRQEEADGGRRRAIKLSSSLNLRVTNCGPSFLSTMTLAFMPSKYCLQLGKSPNLNIRLSLDALVKFNFISLLKKTGANEEPSVLGGSTRPG